MGGNGGGDCPPPQPHAAAVSSVYTQRKCTKLWQHRTYAPNVTFYANNLQKNSPQAQPHWGRGYPHPHTAPLRCLRSLLELPSSSLRYFSPLPLGCMTLSARNVNWRLWNKLGPIQCVLGVTITYCSWKNECLYTSVRAARAVKERSSGSEWRVCLEVWTKSSVFIYSHTSTGRLMYSPLPI